MSPTILNTEIELLYKNLCTKIQTLYDEMSSSGAKKITPDDNSLLIKTISPFAQKIAKTELIYFVENESADLAKKPLPNIDIIEESIKKLQEKGIDRKTFVDALEGWLRAKESGISIS